MSARFFDREGKPISNVQWSQLMVDEAYCKVALDIVDGVEVSTVWLGLNHRYVGLGAPLIFETLLRGGKRDQQQYRYSSEAEAMAGHLRLLSELAQAQALTC